MPRLLLAANDALLDRPPGDLPVVDDARWSAALTSHSLAALVAWIALMALLQAAAWPLARVLFRALPDRGWGFTRLLTLLLAAYPVWLLASLEAIAFGAVWCGTALVLVAALAWLGARRIPDPERSSAARVWYRTPAIVGAEVVFWLFFFWFLTYRFLNPDSWHVAWGGEKPMEFAHLNAILRSAQFPPVDPWYAGGTLNYYYFGGYLVAFLLKITGIPSEIGFNLAQPTVIAFLAAGAWSVGCGLASRIGRSARLTLIGGALAVLLVNIVGNLVAAARLLAVWRGGEVVPYDYVYWVWDPRQIVPRTINEFPYFTALYADLHAHVVAMPMSVLVVGLCLTLAFEPRSLVRAVGRPRAHRTDVAILLLRLFVVGLVLGCLYMTNAWDVPVYAAVTLASLLLAARGIRTWWRRIAVAIGACGAIAVLAGAVATPFIASFLTRYGEIGTVSNFSPLHSIEAHFGVFLLVTLFGLTTVSARHWGEASRIAHPAVAGSILLIVLLWRWSIAASDDDSIYLADALTAFVVAGWLLLAVALAYGPRLDFGLPPLLPRVVALSGWLVVIWALVVDRVVLALLLGVGLAASIVWLRLEGVGVRFAAMLIAAAMFVAGGVEVVYLVDDLGGGPWYRMNTVFKFYNAVWVMAALGSSALLIVMIRNLAFPEAATPTGALPAGAVLGDRPGTVRQEAEEAGAPVHVDMVEGDAIDTVETQGAGSLPSDGRCEPNLVSSPPPPSSPWSVTWSQFGLAVSSLAILAALVYPLVATGVRLDQRFPQDGRHWTLNALDWMGYGEVRNGSVTLTYDGDRAAIEWLNENVGGTPVIAEAVLGAYMCAGSRFSVHTGLPAVVGWTWHETQQRGVNDLFQREADIRDLYTSGDPAVVEAVIARYGIEYIVAGELERWYPEPDCRVSDNTQGLATLEALVGTRLEVAFTSGDTVIYRVVDP